jgi:hypothetical protein
MTYLEGEEKTRLRRSMLKNDINTKKERQILPENGDRLERAHHEHIYMQYISTLRKQSYK